MNVVVETLAYLLFHICFGIVGGKFFVYFKKRKIPSIGTWTVSVFWLAITIGLAALIGQLARLWSIQEAYKFASAALLLVSFALTICFSLRKS